MSNNHWHGIAWQMREENRNQMSMTVMAFTILKKRINYFGCCNDDDDGNSNSSECHSELYERIISCLKYIYLQLECVNKEITTN